MFFLQIVTCFTVCMTIVHGSPHYGLNLLYPRFYVDCGPTVAVHDVNIDGCRDFSCKLQTGKEAKLNFMFTPAVATDNATLEILRLNKTENKYFPFVTDDICANGLLCPLKVEAYEYTKNITIPPNFEKDKHLFKILLKGAQGNTLLCAIFVATVV